MYVSMIVTSLLSVSRDQKKKFQELVEMKFHEWLLETGHRQELDSLVPPSLTPLNGSNGPTADTAQVKDCKPVRNGRAGGQSPLAC